MTLEERLKAALHRADAYQPSPDLFARVQRSIEEDLAHRRRLMMVGVAITAVVVVSILYFQLTVSPAPEGMSIAAWEIALFDTTLLAIVLIVLGPNIRRFAQSYVEDIFHLNPTSGDRFLRVLDMAYYVLFSGLIIVDADAFGPWLEEIPISEALQVSAEHIGFFLAAMGILHAVNIAVLPILGLVFNSLMRIALRSEAGADAPPEAPAARVIDRNARGFALGAAVAVLAVAVSLGIGPVAQLVFGGS